MKNDAKILVVDDTPANLEVITETLSSVGYYVVAAISGERALKRLQTYVPDLILLDVQMPGIDGFETCQKIKSNPNTAGIPIIFITALTDTQSIVKGFFLGAVDYIGKPFQESELLARVHTHLQLQSLNKSLEEQVDKRTAELKTTLEELQQSKLQLIQSEKMSALGNLVAGVAHEVNNPVGFIVGNLSEAKRNLTDLIEHLNLYRQGASANQIEDHGSEIDIEYILEDLPHILNSMTVGCDRILGISTSLRTFSRADKDYKVPFNLHDGIDSTVLILKHRLKANNQRPEIEIVNKYGDIPLVECFPGQINQVFMNILANAIDALDEVARQSSFDELQNKPQQITIRTAIKPEDNLVEIRICDNGKGMTEEVKAKVFDQLFTTKEVGKGTGLGLSISYQVIVDKHQGKLECYSTLNQGTEFIIELPIHSGVEN
ncbi:MAG: response regulator [Cyanobacteria bacterium J06592_8]